MTVRSQQSGDPIEVVPKRGSALEAETPRSSSLLDRRRSRRHSSLGPKWVGSLVENLLVIAFVLLAAVGLLHHELWRDETQSWLIARDSTSLVNLFRNTHYEGHPLLWHYCLYGLSRISRNPLIMQGFNLVLATGSVVLIVKKSPFTLLQRGLMVFGYFTLYEYALLSRSYGLGVFLTFVFCALYCQRQPRFWAMTLVLILLANTSLLGLIMSATLAIALYYRQVLSPEQRKNKRIEQQRAQRTGQRSARTMTIGASLFALCLGWGLSVVQIARSLLNPSGLAGFTAASDAATEPANQAIVVAATQPTQLDDLNKLLQIFLKSYLPLPTFSFHFWNGHLLEDQALRPDFGLYVLLLSGLLVGVSLLMAIRLLRSTPLFLSVYLFGSLSMMSLFVLVHRGSTRHHGHLFILLIACLWLAQWSRRESRQKSSSASVQMSAQRASVSATSQRRPKLPSRTLPKPPPSVSAYPLLFTGLLCVQAFSGLYAYGSDILFPFSASYQTAQIIKTSQLAELPILGLNQRPVSPLSGYLDRPIYYPEAERSGSFWDISYPEFKEADEVAAAITAFSKDNASYIAVLTAPLAVEAFEADSKLLIDYLAYVGPSIVDDEAFYLYRVENAK